MRRALGLTLGVCLVALVATVTIRAITPPPPRGLDARQSDFSAARALEHVRAIAAAPHPVGSAAHESVLGYVLGVLRALGLEARVQETTCAVRLAGADHGAAVKNVIAKLPGSRGSGAAVMLAAHYDSVPQSRGASDDGSGVATLLETARALAAGPRLQNDVVFLFSDAEEVGICGAVAFVDEELPKLPIGVALNFEARGTSGAVAMYDTSAGNGALIEALAATASRPVSTSLLSALAHTLPNDSDATAFERAGIATYAFAYVDHLHEYHAYTDSADALDAGSLQHDGEYALPLVRYFGDSPLPPPAKRDVTYFDFICAGVVSYSALAARVLAASTLAAFVAVVARARRDGRVTLRGVAAGAGLALAAVVVATVAAAVPGLVLGRVVDPFLLFARPSLGAVASLAAGVAAFVLVYLRAFRETNGDNAAFGAMALWAGVLLLLAILAPVTSFPFQWPLLSVVAGAAYWTIRRDAPAWRLDLAATASLIPAAFFWGYLAYSLFVMMGAGAPPIVALVVAFALLLAVPVLARLRAVERRWLAAAAGIGALGAGVAAVVVVGGARDVPRRDSLVYTASPDRGSAFWSTSDRVDAYVSQRIPNGQSSAPAPVFGYTRPKVESHWSDDGELRRYVLDAEVLPGARCLRASQERGARIVDAKINGKAVTPLVRFSPEMDEKLFKMMMGDTSPPHWSLEFCGARGEIHLELAAPRGAGPIALGMQEVIDGLPGPALEPRPAGVYPGWESDVTVVSLEVAP